MDKFLTRNRSSQPDGSPRPDGPSQPDGLSQRGKRGRPAQYQNDAERIEANKLSSRKRSKRYRERRAALTEAQDADRERRTGPENFDAELENDEAYEAEPGQLVVLDDEQVLEDKDYPSDIDPTVAEYYRTGQGIHERDYTSILEELVRPSFRCM